MRKISSAISNSLMFTAAESRLRLKVLYLLFEYLRFKPYRTIIWWVWKHYSKLRSKEILWNRVVWEFNQCLLSIGWMEYIFYPGRSNICMSNSVYRMFSVYFIRCTRSMSSRDNVQQYSLVCGRGRDQTMGSILVKFCAQILERKISVEIVSIIQLFPILHI